MLIKTADEARKNLSELIDETINSHEPVTIIGRHSNAVLISEEVWNSIQETLYLLNIEGMSKSIVDGLNTPISACNSLLEF
jgi:prevent-host-death family protein